MNVLCIEPTMLYQQMLTQVFTDLGVSARFFKNESDALKLLGEETIDLLVTANRLQNITGLQLVEKFREAGHKETTTVLLSADTTHEFVQKCLAYGVTEVLGKNDFGGIERSLRQLVSNKTREHTGKVLLVEDDRAMAQFITHLMEQEGYRVNVFDNGEGAVEMLKHEPHDLIITDVILNGHMTGMGLLNWVRENLGSQEKFPVLIVSGGNDQSRKVELLRQGANDYVDKPFSDAEFLVRVNNLITAKHLFDQVDQQQKDLYRMATTDQLTGLRNRHSLMDIAEKYVSESRRNSFPLSLVVVDLDHFKNINDTYGHAVGDEVLCAVGHCLLTKFRGEDVVARFGGEEFVVLMHRCNLDNAMVKAEELRRAVEVLNPSGLNISASLGVAEISLIEEGSFDSLFRMADEAVYHSKSNGRNQVSTGQLVSKAA